MNKYDQAIVVLNKIVTWDPDFHHMSKEESFVCLQEMAKTFLRNESNKADENVIYTDRWN